jgi:hypothetical protein
MVNAGKTNVIDCHVAAKMQVESANIRVENVGRMWVGTRFTVGGV